MSATVHHLNCGTMRPPSARLVHGAGSLFGPARMVCHCLLVEAPDGLVLVDTGLGCADIADPHARLGGFFLSVVRPVLDGEETALAHVERLGFAARDVRHIVLTHLDLDHAGGLADFPDAEVHVFAAEHAAASAPRTLNERQRYRPAQWSHGARFTLHQASGERWQGFESVRAVVEPSVLIVPVEGHTRGHAAVALETPDGWLLHCGDAYFHHDELRTPPRCPAGLRLFQSALAVDDGARVRNQARLRALACGPSGRALGRERVTLFSAHDPVELARHAPGAAP
ncbi:MAG: MBL fold metallo-hydrolase [Myxococcales bacterium]|nr:MBL fold metallo-hydrolase [Myxococcales bacterium]